MRGTLLTAKTDEIMALFVAPEGYNAVYYGKVRNGKTRNATADIVELLKRGEIVVANWKIDFTGFDERNDGRIRFVNFVFGRKYFYKYNPSNFHYLDPDDLINSRGEYNVHYLSKLVGVHVFIDEGQWLFNSLERYNPADPDMVAKLRLILHGGHYCRSLNIITQRVENINKNIRSQISIWYRCVKRLDLGNIMVFQRWGIEDMKDDMPVEYLKNEKTGRTDIPNGDCKTYFVNKASDPIFKMYNTHAMRSADAIELPTSFDVFETTLWDRFLLVLGMWMPQRLSRAFGGQFQANEGLPSRKLKVESDMGERRLR